MSKQAKPPPPGGKPVPSAPPPPPTWRNWIWPVMLIVIFALWFLLPTRTPSTSLSYTQFLSDVAAHQVKTVQLGAVGSTSSGKLSNGKSYTVVIPPQAGQNLLTTLQDAKVQVSAAPSGQGFGTEVLVYLITFGLPILFFVWIFRRLSKGAGGGLQGALGVGKSRAKVFDEERPSTTFADVAGYEGAKSEIAEVVDFLRKPDRYTRVGALVPRGVLMVGPPGTGKTLLARAVAGEAHAAFFSIAASEFIEAIVGVGASRVRDLFAKAKEAAPAIIFIDELDAIGRSRSGSAAFSGANDEREQTLDQILTEMDGFEGNDAVIVLGATNRPEILDPALLRPGRFDRRVSVSAPDRAGRRKILEVHTRSIPLGADVDLDALASSTPGMVGADLANLANEAALLATRRNHEQVLMADFTDSLEKILLGAPRGTMLAPEDRERTAFHESGHALVGMLTPEADPVRKVSIIPRGMALGVTLSTPDSDRVSYSRDDLEAKIKVALGGRVAEEITYGKITTGAESDIQQLTQIARQMVGRWGMSDKLGPVTLLPSEGQSPFLPGASETSPQTQWLVDQEVQAMIEDAHGQVTELLTEHRAQLESLARALLAAETLDAPAAYAAADVPARPVTVSS